MDAAFEAALRSRANGLGADGKALLQAKTGIDVNNARIQQGAQSAAALAQNGYNPDNPDDNANLIHAIAGGLAVSGAFTAGVGTMLGAAVEGLWAAGNAAACPTEKLFHALGLMSTLSPACGGAACATSGNWTVASVLASSQLPPMPKGSFAALVVPALATYMAQAGNCRASFPPEYVVDAAVAIWNRTHAGPAVDYYVPSLSNDTVSMEIIPSSKVTTTGPGVPGLPPNTDPNVFYAFGPMSATYFKDIGAAPPPPSSWSNLAPARVVRVNTGSLIGAQPSIIKHVAVAGGLSLGGLAVGSILYSYLSHETVGRVLDGLWNQGKELVRGTFGEVTRAVDVRENPLLLGEARRGTTVQTLIFPRSRYTPSRAKDWAAKHGYKYGKVDVTARSVRLRQHDPDRFARLRTVRFGDSGIQAVVGPMM